MTHKKHGYRFENDWPLEKLDEAFKKVKAATTIPVKVKIEADHYVLNLENVRQIISSANKLSVMDCTCRATYGHCDAPLTVCLDMNEVAERNIVESIAREITLDEALDILEKTGQAGLVHMALGHGESYKPGVINSVCSCCSCCCGILSGILRYEMAPHLLKSLATSITEELICTDCGDCVERCQFGAREIVDGSLSINQDLCFGCGLCVSTCPTDAITLVDKFGQ